MGFLVRPIFRWIALVAAVFSTAPPVLGQSVLTPGQTALYSLNGSYLCYGSGTCYATAAVYNISVPATASRLDLTVPSNASGYPVDVYAVFGANPSQSSTGLPNGATLLGFADSTHSFQGSIGGSSSALALQPGTWTIGLYVPFQSGATIVLSGSILANLVSQPLTITSLSPSSATAGGAAFALTVNGSGFVSGATVYWNGAPLTTTYSSSSQLTASVPASLIANSGSFSVMVINPGGSSSGSVTFSVIAPAAVPTIASVSPSSAIVGGSGFTLTVNGTNFDSTCVVNWNRSPLLTTYTSATQLTASIPAVLIANGGSASITVVSGGGAVTSNAVSFPITSTSRSVLAHIAAGDGWTTVIFLYNNSSAPVTVSLTLHGNDGTIFSLPMTVTSNGQTQSLMALANTTIAPEGTMQISMGGGIAITSVGWADLTSSAPLNGFAIFRTISANSPTSEGTVPLQTQFPGMLLIPYDNTSGSVAAVALANVGTTATTVTATVWDENGILLGTQLIALPAGGHTAFTLPQQLTMTAGKVGYVQFQASGPGELSAIGLRFSAYGTFTSVPVVSVQ